MESVIGRRNRRQIVSRLYMSALKSFPDLCKISNPNKTFHWIFPNLHILASQPHFIEKEAKPYGIDF